MKKVIRISNDPNFNSGVLSYVSKLDLNKLSYDILMTTPRKVFAIDFENKADEYINLAMYHVKQSFPKATVETIYIK